MQTLRYVALRLRQPHPGSGCLSESRQYQEAATWMENHKTHRSIKYLSMYTTSARLSPKLGRRYRVLLTLRPENMAMSGQKVFDLSGISGPLHSRTVDGLLVQPYYGFHRRRRIPFPKETRGLLYFRYVPEDEDASQIRFRLCNHVSEFDAGSDLRLPDGEFWNISLPAIRRGTKIYHGISSLLMKEYSLGNMKTTGQLWLQRHLLTLSPEKFVTMRQEVFDLSGIICPMIQIAQNDAPAVPPKASQKIFLDRVTYDFENGKYMPFPPDTKGVFYYAMPSPQRTPFGQLRFRKCSDVALFDSGTDLCLDSGEPWKMELWDILRRRFKHLLIRERLVDKHTIANIRDKLSLRKPLVLFTLDQPFCIDFSRSQYTVQLATASVLSKLMFRIWRQYPGQTFNGRAMVRLELSTLPEHIKQGPTLVLRILELLTPITRFGHVRPGMASPQPGSLLAVNDKRKIWSLPIEKLLHSKAATAFVEASKSRVRSGDVRTDSQTPDQIDIHERVPRR